MNNANDPALGAMHAVWERMAGCIAVRGADAGRNGCSSLFRRLSWDFRMGARLLKLGGIQTIVFSPSVKGHFHMSPVLPWTLFALGIGHILYELIKFRQPLQDAVASGFIGKFGIPEVRRSAFWFLMFGSLLMLAGQVAVHAASINDAYLVRLVGYYLFAISAVGVLVLPKSPFLAGLVTSGLLLALGFGFL